MQTTLIFELTVVYRLCQAKNIYTDILNWLVGGKRTLDRWFDLGFQRLAMD